jgi:hypothetical protein
MLSLLRWHGLALRSDSSNRPSKVFWSGELAQAPSNFKSIHSGGPSTRRDVMFSISPWKLFLWIIIETGDRFPQTAEES